MRGNRSTYCSPTADTLRTSACRSAGICGDVSSDSVASPALDVDHAGDLADLHAAVGDVAEPVETLRWRAARSVTVSRPDPEQRRQPACSSKTITADADDRGDR